LRTHQVEEIPLVGGHVNDVVRVGGTVRRPTGPWTPAVHALLAHLAEAGLAGVPRVRGTDERGREVLDYLPGRVIDIGPGQRQHPISDDQLGALAAWTARLHAATASFRHPGPWRFAASGALVCHNDIAPRNACYDGGSLAGVFDWDCAGPSAPTLELAFLAWSAVPLWEPAADPAHAAARLRVIAGGYGAYDPRDVLLAVPYRIEHMVTSIVAGARAGDPGMVRLMRGDQHLDTMRTRAALLDRIPAILAAV
jgi:hypothetical protein